MLLFSFQDLDSTEPAGSVKKTIALDRERAAADIISKKAGGAAGGEPGP